jgi:hypothetical protein
MGPAKSERLRWIAVVPPTPCQYWAICWSCVCCSPTLLCQWLLYLPAIGLNKRLVSSGVGVMTVRLQGRARPAKSHHDDRTLE